MARKLQLTKVQAQKRLVFCWPELELQYLLHNTVLDNLALFTVRCIYIMIRPVHRYKKQEHSNGHGWRGSQLCEFHRTGTLVTCMWVNYQAFILLHFDSPHAPSSPLSSGWRLDDGKCLPLRYMRPDLLQTLHNLVEHQHAPVDESDSASDSASDSDGNSDLSD